MITKFSVKAFKSLLDTEVEFGTVNLFIGANGSGKSNLLESIGILGAAAHGSVDDEALLRRGVRPGLPSLYKSSFQNSTTQKQIRLDAQSEHAKYAVSLLNPLDSPSPKWQYTHEILERGGDKILGRSPRSSLNLEPTSGLAALKRVDLKAEDPASKLLNDLSAYAIYSPDTPTLRGLIQDPQVRDPVGLSGGRLAEGFGDTFLSPLFGDEQTADALEDVLDLVGWSTDISVVSSASVPISKSVPQLSRVLRFKDQYMNQSRNQISGYDASEGALFVLFISVLMHNPNSPRVFSVDNFDQALNPRLARRLTRLICEWALERGDRQLLLTSHNPLVLDGLPINRDEVRLFTVERSRNGQTVVNRVQLNEQILLKASEGIPLSQQWVMGTFGGIPTDL